jgi:hypothetical protein
MEAECYSEFLVNFRWVQGHYDRRHNSSYVPLSELQFINTQHLGKVGSIECFSSFVHPTGGEWSESYFWRVSVNGSVAFVVLYTGVNLIADL